MRKCLRILARFVQASGCWGCVFLILCFSSSTSAQTNFWHQCAGPYGGGEVDALTFDSSGNVYAAIASFGIYISSDDGSTWIQDDSGLTDLNVQSFAALHGGVMLASTFSGIYRSSGIGHGWTLVNSKFQFNPIDSSGIAVNAMMQGPRDTVYAATSGGLMESIDSGTTWSPLFSGLSPFNSLAMSAGGRIYAGSTNAVITSGDSGATWTGSSVGYLEIPWHYTFSIAPLPDGNVALSSTRDGVILYTSACDTVIGELTGSNSPGDGLLAACRLAGSDTSADLYDGTYTGLYRLASGSTSWTRISLDSVDYIISSLICHGGTILVGTASHGLYRSTDYGATWTHPTYGIGAVSVLGLAVAKSRNTTNPAGCIFAATSGNGIFRSTDNGEDWTDANNGITYNYPYWEYSVSAGPTGILYTVSNEGAFYSVDGGTKWNAFSSFPASPGAGIATLRTNVPGDTLGLLMTRSQTGIFVSSDGGTTWLMGATDYVNDYGTFSSAFLPNDTSTSGDGFIFVGGDYALVRSSDEGAHWYLDISGMTSFIRVSALCVPSTVHPSFPGGSIFAGTNNGVYLSTDYGLHWSPSGLSGIIVTSLAGTPDGSIFAGTQFGGVYRLYRSDTSWTQENSGLAGVDVSSLAVDSLGYLYAATEKGVYRSMSVVDAITRTKVGGPFKYSLAQNFPNPFNPTTVISYQLARASHVNITIYDVLGRELAVLVNAEKAAGYHEVSFDGSQFPSGVYFYRLATPEYSTVRKMMLVK